MCIFFYNVWFNWVVDVLFYRMSSMNVQHKLVQNRRYTDDVIIGDFNKKTNDQSLFMICLFVCDELRNMMYRNDRRLNFFAFSLWFTWISVEIKSENNSNLLWFVHNIFDTSYLYGCQFLHRLFVVAKAFGDFFIKCIH